MKSVLAVVLGLFWAAAVLGCNGAVRSSTTPEASSLTTTPPKVDAWPRTYEEAVTRLVKQLGDEDKTLVRALPKDYLIAFHMEWGMGIRNDFGLWGGNRELAVSCTLHAHPELREAAKDPAHPLMIHPDDISSIIMEGVWEALRHPDQRAGAETAKIVIRFHLIEGESPGVRSEMAGETFDTPEALAAKLKGRTDLAKVAVEVVSDKDVGWLFGVPALQSIIKAGCRNVKLTEAPDSKPSRRRPDVP
jgi:hypothetical protein